MIIHAMDSLPAYEAVISQPASPTANGRPAFDSARMVAAGDRVRVSDMPVPAAAAGLCFVRPGSGGWSNVIAVCDDGRISTLDNVRRPALTPAVFHGSVARNATMNTGTSGSNRNWASWVSAALLTLGIALSIKSAAMTLSTGQARRFG